MAVGIFFGGLFGLATFALLAPLALVPALLGDGVGWLVATAALPHTPPAFIASFAGELVFLALVLCPATLVGLIGAGATAFSARWAGWALPQVALTSSLVVAVVALAGFLAGVVARPVVYALVRKAME